MYQYTVAYTREDGKFTTSYDDPKVNDLIASDNFCTGYNLGKCSRPFIPTINKCIPNFETHGWFKQHRLVIYCRHMNFYMMNYYS